MTIGLMFWIIVMIWLLFGLFVNWPKPNERPYPLVSHVIFTVLLILLGWHDFGPPIHQ